MLWGCTACAFSRRPWRCTYYVVRNRDLVPAWQHQRSSCRDYVTREYTVRRRPQKRRNSLRQPVGSLVIPSFRPANGLQSRIPGSMSAHSVNVMATFHELSPDALHRLEDPNMSLLLSGLTVASSFAYCRQIRLLGIQIGGVFLFL